MKFHCSSSIVFEILPVRPRRHIVKCMMKFTILMLLVSIAGCGSDAPPEIQSGYGRARGESLNGLNVLATILREMGHEVRFAQGANDEVADFADVIIRCSNRSGPVPADEAEWLDGFLNITPGGAVVYAPNDANMLFEYWNAAEVQAEKTSQPELAKMYKRRKESAQAAIESAAESTDKVEPAPNWFQVVGDRQTRYEPGKNWQGPLAFDDIQWNLHQTLDDKNGEVLLSCSKGAAIIRRGPRIFLANAGLLLNAGLVDGSRRKLLDHLLDEIPLTDEPRYIVILIGADIFESGDSANALWRFLTTWPTSALASHLVLIGLVGCWYKAIRRGAVRRIVSENWTLLSNHARAVGQILVQSEGFEQKSAEVLQKYAGWRSTSAYKRFVEQNRQEDHPDETGEKE